MTTPAAIAQRHLAHALKDAHDMGQDRDAVLRQMLAGVIAAFLMSRSAGDVRAELNEAAHHLDPDEDFMFMRP